MSNSCRIEGRGEILRYEGAPAEANPETNVQYVRVSYPTRNGLQKINVEFCMTDGKGQHYDEPFSATSWLGRSYTQIVPVPTDYIESVHIWRDGYAPPVIPEAYREEIKEYVTKFFYADEYPTGALMGDSLNDAGFTVFMKDGSSVSFGVDYAKLDGRCYKIAKPEEMPDWLAELLVLPVRTKPAYGDLIKIDDTIKAEVDPYIISYAVDIMISQIDRYVFMRGIEIIDAKLTALECISTGAADQYGNAVEMYRVEYRLLPKNADGILLTDDMKMEDGWLTEWSSEGQPYMLFYLGDGNYREILRFINTEELDATYSTDTMLERYGNKYTAAAMEIYHTFVGQYKYQFYVMLGTGGAPIPPYYHEKHRVTYFPDSNGWLSGSGKPLDPNASFPTVTISDDPDDVNSDFLAFNRFIKHGELEIRDENFNILDLSPQVFYDASDLYALPPGNYHVSFDITVPGKYISELGEHEWTMYMCIFRLEVVDGDNYSDQPQNIRIDVPQSDETAMCLYAWPVVLENIMEWLPVEDISSVIDVISTSSFTELDENNDSFNPKLAELNITGDISGGDVLDRYIFIHTHDYREELVKMLNYASDEELNALTKPLCILIYDYNIEKQEEFAYAIFNGRYYLADNESKIRIMDMFETLVDKHDTIAN